MFYHTPPIQRLPVELLSYIFLLGTEDLSKQDGSDRSLPFNTESIKTPLLISSVNKHWRNIALNTPALWTTLCVTADMVHAQEDHDISLYTTDVFNTAHLTTYIQRSRRHPLDILIDARDQDWDFSEPEFVHSSHRFKYFADFPSRIPSEYECDTYTPPFSSIHMSTAISLLLPHLCRWRSIAILTDSWAPMYAALQQIQPVITTFGAPCLESLTLMRCNDFVSYSSTFQPHEMKGPAFLTLADEHSSRSLLPRLKNLTLRGVHVDWSSLASVLYHSHASLRTLELASHSLDTRPSFHEFHNFLAAASSLNKLVVSGSGPYLPDIDDDEDESILNDDDLCPVLLPNLRDLTIGYRSAYEAQVLLESINAPSAQVLTMEDSAYPGEAEDIDAGKLLTYVGTGRFHDGNEHIFVSYINGRHFEVALDEGAKSLVSRSERSADKKSNSTCPFPLLEKVTLTRVKACPGTLHAFFNSLQNVRKLELSGMSTHALYALHPQGLYHRQPPSSNPCPKLQSLCIRRPEFTQLQDFVVLVGSMAGERLKKGSCGLQEVDIYVDEAGEFVTEDVVQVSPGTTVTVFKEAPRDVDDMEPDEDDDSDAVDPFRVGGAFNDPIFDTFYARGVASF